MDESQKRYKEYLNFIKKYPKYLGPKGDYKKGEIEIVSDVSLFPKCEERAVKLMTDSGVEKSEAEKRARIGVFDQSRWGVSLHEPLRLPDGSYTTFVRAISWGTLTSGEAGVVIVPFTSNGRLILMKNFRHNVRAWSYEFPRGAQDPGNSLLKTLKTELSEELGARILEDPVKIGEIFPDSGFLGSKVNIFKAKVEITGLATHEATEAIGKILFITVGEFKKMVAEGKILDGYTLSALTLLNNET